MQMNEGHCFRTPEQGVWGLCPPDVGAKLTFASLSFRFLDISASFFIEEK